VFVRVHDTTGVTSEDGLESRTGARMRYAPFSLVMEGDRKAYLDDNIVVSWTECVVVGRPVRLGLQTPIVHIIESDSARFSLYVNDVDVCTHPMRTTRNGENSTPQACRTMGQCLSTLVTRARFMLTPAAGRTSSRCIQ